MMSSANKKSINGGQRRRGNFDSVPADDGFRNYMARKIELQRKQFGLVLPPPPPSPPPKPSPPKILKRAKLAKTIDKDSSNKDFPTPQFTDTVNATPSKKSVRFHQNLEIEGVSQVLTSLKQRHTGGRKKLSRSAHKRRRRSRGLTVDASGQPLTEDHAPNNSLHDSISNEGENSESSHSYNSVLGVLDNLQKRHGASSSKKKRAPSILHSSRKRRDNPTSVLESLDSAEEAGFVGSISSVDINEGSDGAGGSTSMSKSKRESPRFKVTSILEGLEPISHNNIGQQYESKKNNCLYEEHREQHSLQYLKSPPEMPQHLVHSQLTQRSPAEESTSHSINDSHDMSPCELSQKLERYEKDSVLEENSTSIDQTKIPLSNEDKPLRKPKHRPDLFLTGVVVLVNGHTYPDATTLMRLLHKHGGDLEKYETQRVTHIIAEQLSVAKANVCKRQKKPTPVCHPDWIVDSVEKGKLLPFGDYLLEDVRDEGAVGTKSVKSFFSSNPTSKNASSPAIEDHNIGSEESHVRHTKEVEERMLSKEVPTNNESSPSRWHDSHPSKAKYHLNGQVRTVGNDPNFLESYFNNSRLSYIGSFKQRIKPTKRAVPNSPSRAGAKKFVLLVDMDCFFASVALRKYPQYRSKPVAVGHSHVERRSHTTENTKQSKNSSSELSTCNYIARKYGIRKGMFLGDAIQLCPDLVVLPYDFEGFEEVSGIVADQLHGYAEQYHGCVEIVSCDESYVEISISTDDCAGSDIYDFVNDLAEHIRADIVKKTECTASIGIGPNKLLAKLAADRVKPNACCVVKNWRDFLDNRDLRDIPGIGRKFQKKLHTHGLCTVNDIWDLGDDADSMLGEIIGQGNAHKIVQYCYGKDERPVTPAIRKSIGAECNYGVRFDGPYGVEYMMQGLAKEVQKRMDGVGVKGSKLVLKVLKSKDFSKVPGKFLGHGSCDSFSRSINISLTRDESIISTAAMKLYKKLVCDEGFDERSVRGMGIVINALRSDDEANSLSPSKLFTWLKNDGSGAKNIRSQEVSEDSKISKQFDFAIDENDSFAPEVPNDSVPNNSLPTFSQLDQDVLHNLPEDILLEVKSMYSKSSSPQRPSSKGSSPKPSKTRQAAIQIPGQTSVKRMMKLACVKSGEDKLDGHDVSLSQLDCLPLELQLQIANEDDVRIMKKAKHKTKKSNIPHNLILYSNQSELPEVEILSPQRQEIEIQEHNSSRDLSSTFYQENVAPLCSFISANPNPDNDTVDTVQDFLSLCIQEERIDDAVVFLRTIKNMQNGWGSDIYAQLRKSTVENVFSTVGSMLDVMWLGL